MNKSNMRFCHKFKKWLVWDGKRWCIDETDRARRLAKDALLEFHRQAMGDSDTEKFARDSMNERRITTMLSSAATELYVIPDELDRQAYYLNCTNGTLDLMTGTLKPHSPEDLITKLCHVEYNPSAECPRFTAFLSRIMGDNPDAEPMERTEHLVSFLQRAFGYSLTGDVGEKSVFCFFGDGNSGKTTLLDAFRNILSEYSAQINIDSLMQKPGGESNASLADLSDLRGARFVVTSEAAEEMRLDEAKIKYISAGAGKIKSIRKYENPIEFEATHKLFIEANYRPVVRGVDRAIWNRFKTIPFTVSIPDEEIDKSLGAKLREEAPGILAWAVQGCLDWQMTGLGIPEEVSEASEDWKRANNPLADFIDNCCLVGNGFSAQSMPLFQEYQKWAKDNGQRWPLDNKKFKRRLQLLQYEYVHTGSWRGWRGIGLLAKSHDTP
jgi:putative DNA primase/helicase